LTDKGFCTNESSVARNFWSAEVARPLMTVIAKVSETETKTEISAAEATEEASEEFEAALKNTLKSVQEAVSLILFDCLLAFHWTRRKKLLLSISGLWRVED
jgi:hypothetical protein